MADLVRVTPIHEALKQKGLLPAEHFVDNHYVSSKLLVTSKKDYGVALVGPIKPYRKARGFGIDMFKIDWERESVFCPAGKQSTYWRPEVPKSGRERIRVGFGLIATFDDVGYEAGERYSTRARSRSKLARPYIWRLMVLSRLTCPSS